VAIVVPRVGDKKKKTKSFQTTTVYISCLEMFVLKIFVEKTEDEDTE